MTEKYGNFGSNSGTYRMRDEKADENRGTWFDSRNCQIKNQHDVSDIAPLSGHDIMMHDETLVLSPVPMNDFHIPLQRIAFRG